MKSKTSIKILSLSLTALIVTSCSSNKLALQSNDDVYFTDVEAKYVTYNESKSKTAYSDAPEFTSNRNYDNNYDSRFDINNLGFNYNWQDYYYMDRLGYSPFWGPTTFLGNNNFYRNGWSFSLGIGSWNNYYNNGWNNYYNNGWNNFGYNGNFNRWSPYGGFYSFYQPGYYGNQGYYGNNGYYGNGFYRDPIYSARPNNPRPRGSYDNTRGADNGGGSIPLPPPGRPIRPDVINSPGAGDRKTDGIPTYNPNSSNSSGRPMRPSGSSDAPSQRPTSTPSQPVSRPTRSERPSNQPTSQPESSRPTRTESRPSSPPPSSGSSSSSSSSSGSSNTRPTRTGGN